LTAKVFKKGEHAGVLFDIDNKVVPSGDLAKKITKGARLSSRVKFPNLWVGDTEVNWAVRFVQGGLNQAGEPSTENLLVRKNSPNQSE
jgi:hypothetical protein